MLVHLWNGILADLPKNDNENTLSVLSDTNDLQEAKRKEQSVTIKPPFGVGGSVRVFAHVFGCTCV